MACKWQVPSPSRRHMLLDYVKTKDRGALKARLIIQAVRRYFSDESLKSWSRLSSPKPARACFGRMRWRPGRRMTCPIVPRHRHRLAGTAGRSFRAADRRRPGYRHAAGVLRTRHIVARTDRPELPRRGKDVPTARSFRRRRSISKPPMAIPPATPKCWPPPGMGHYRVFTQKPINKRAAGSLRRPLAFQKS